QFLADLQKPCLIILNSTREAEKLLKEVQFFMSNSNSSSLLETTRLYEFPLYDISPLTGLSPHREGVSRRLQALYALISGKNPIVITSFEAVFFRILPKEALIRAIEYFEAGEEVDRDLFVRRLEICGYQRTSLVEERGDYSIRGGVIDIFPPLYTLPIRMEFWGDRLESVRQFDPLSQRSQNHIKEIVLLPAAEIIMDKDNIKRARSMGRLPPSYEDGMRFPGQEAWVNHFYPRLDTLFHYLPKEALITLFDSHRAESACQRMKEKFERDVESLRKEAAEKGNPFPETENVLIPFEEISQSLESYQQLDFTGVELGQKNAPERTIHITGHFDIDDDLEVRLETKGRVSMAPLAEKISEWLASRASVVLVSRTEQQTNRLREILANYEVQVDRIVQCWADIPPGTGLSMCLGRLSKGFTWPDIGLYVVSEDEIFGAKKARSRQKGKARESALTWSSLSQLKAGDLVVHEEHGIGRYYGLLKMEIAHKANDFLVIEYANNDRLYIPADRISIFQKYVGADEGNLKLDRLGGRSWNIAKQKAKKSVKRIAKQLIELYALRKYRKGYSFSPPDNYYREFEATFEHEETPDQIKAIEDVLEDMGSEGPMDRLICGDVGFGKTEVALRAAFKAVSDGKQVALLVPTTVLAEQHYETFKRRLEPYSVNIGILSRFKTRAEQLETLSKLRSGAVNVLIGTHRILQKDVKFGDLGLLIIDEEQRFGVRQKEALKKYRALVDVLAITATPIPRTFQMSMMGVRDLSIIETPPEDRFAIQTHLSPYDESLIIRAVQNELERGGQVFFVHNKVQTIDLVADRLRQLVPTANFAVAHGQMKERELESTMMRFLKREIDVLVCTTIIESGLDIPTANTIIINEADRLGLAQIYQLRGRVGRAKEKAYAYLLVSNGSSLTRDAEKRLKALMDFSELGAGLHLAMHDLKIRGGGNILGFAQAGHISAIGYELYLRLIERAIAELKGEEWHDEINPEISVDIPAFLPGDYVIDTDIRLNLYRRLSCLCEKSELEAMADEINDRFGPPPQEVKNLLGVMSIRLLLKEMRINRLDVSNNSLTLTFSPDTRMDPQRLASLAGQDPRRFQFLSQNKLKLKIGKFSPEEDFPRIEKAIQALYLHS
ncbi:MAG TPA: transcription-repair coupling factor, partial [Acidobacteriota bacterium]|nr:transcription-repair coupling factor [Acidobacteriota bacterium]